ncbi:lipoyl(octanoyl) transferase LipB [Desulforhabdus amnigena]|jgi:lipoyl(octanoyl) transferase|uniref:Octanoyltransferase n=1 Tax=Desulforhabdus amnigena TaxID=40218 RepID=A0A9W6LA09_9BACT|nr:lipoyl(octanoyl) transferase LipB [Desulforhabdus amnigena]NLJ28103.1 lipoyl(octanoyl) transferase LipB [Deltaproteobacteria bacterium]GLI35506.1 octanoyltransferase [Desulforhabdus amnigena]
MDRRICHVCSLGRIDYGIAWKMQKALAAARAEERIPDTLLLLEHPPTYTLGRRTDPSHFLVPRELLLRQGVAVYHVDRGGDITFHGPGQLVGYPVLNLQGCPGGPSRYLRDLEEVLIEGLAALGVASGRLSGFTGVWVGHEKIAAIGVKINARRITEHGFALNVSTDLHYFNQIVPCGIREKGVTSLEQVLGRSVAIYEVEREVAHAFGKVFDLEMVEVSPIEIASFIEEKHEAARS